MALGVDARAEEAGRVALASSIATELRGERERDAAEARLRVRRAEWETAAAVGAPPGVAGAADLQLRARHLEALRADCWRLAEILRSKEAALSAARAESVRHREALAAARRRVRVLEHHRDAWLAARARERARREELADDEIVSARRRAAR